MSMTTSTMLWAFVLASASMVDVVILNDEIDLLRYRLQLHATLMQTTVVVEANVTFSGKPKPLFARESLTAAEVTEHAIILLQVPFSAAELADPSPWIRENAQRTFLNGWLLEHFPESLVYMSDVDELLDPAIRFTEHIQHCMVASLRHYLYHEQ